MDLSVDDEGVLDFNILMTEVESVLTSPEIVWEHFTDFSGYSAKITLIVTFALGIYALMKYTSRKRLHRKGVEHGSARWANEKEEKFLEDKPEKKKGEMPPAKPKSPFETDNNIILTQEVRMSLNTRQHRENLNVLVIGGSGSGKSRFYVKPNIMQLNTSYVVTDPKGELLRSCGRLLQKAGYEIRVFNLIDMAHSNNYNPFNYVYDKNGEMNKTYVPSSDATFNFLAAMMYTQLFDTLYDTANFKYGGRLPVHVRCLLDEFANIGTIPDFDKLLATMRSMEISANIIILCQLQFQRRHGSAIDCGGEIRRRNSAAYRHFGV